MYVCFHVCSPLCAGARGRKEDVVGARQTGEVAHHEMKTEGVELQ